VTRPRDRQRLVGLDLLGAQGGVEGGDDVDQLRQAGVDGDVAQLLAEPAGQ
jgi:hypothetical protein